MQAAGSDSEKFPSGDEAEADAHSSCRRFQIPGLFKFRASPASNQNRFRPGPTPVLCGPRRGAATRRPLMGQPAARSSQRARAALRGRYCPRQDSNPRREGRTSSPHALLSPRPLRARRLPHWDRSPHPPPTRRPPPLPNHSEGHPLTHAPAAPLAPGGGRLPRFRRDVIAAPRRHR
jgi:hypothetical protein